MSGKLTKPLPKELIIKATVENIGIVTAFVDELLEALDCPLKTQTQIDIAIDELFGNIAQYAYPTETGDVTVRVEVVDNPMGAVISFVDKGVPYDPLTKEEPDITLSAEDRAIGGLGIFIVKEIMDELHYMYKDGQNILTIRKNI